MTDFVLLNNVDHADLRVRLRDGGAFGAAVNQVPLVPTEIDDAQRDYPIVLRKQEDGTLRLMALLGLDREENLFCDADGWDGRYVPALLQRGPFRIGLQPRETSDGEPMIHVDLDDPAVNRDEGQPLFLPHGGHAPYLDHMMRVLSRLHGGHAIAGPMIDTLTKAELVEPIKLRIALDETTRYDVPDCFTVSSQRLAALDGATLERLNQAGYLKLAFMIAASLGNVPRLIERKNARLIERKNARQRLAARS